MQRCLPKSLSPGSNLSNKKNHCSAISAAAAIHHRSRNSAYRVFGGKVFGHYAISPLLDNFGYHSWHQMWIFYPRTWEIQTEKLDSQIQQAPTCWWCNSWKTATGKTNHSTRIIRPKLERNWYSIFTELIALSTKVSTKIIKKFMQVKKITFVISIKSVMTRRQKNL